MSKIDNKSLGVAATACLAASFMMFNTSQAQAAQWDNFTADGLN